MAIGRYLYRNLESSKDEEMLAFTRAYHFAARLNILDGNKLQLKM